MTKQELAALELKAQKKVHLSLPLYPYLYPTSSTAQKRLSKKSSTVKKMPARRVSTREGYQKKRIRGEEMGSLYIFNAAPAFLGLLLGTGP